MHPAVYVCAYESTVGTVARPQASIYSSATTGVALLEAAAVAGTSAAFRLRLCRLTNTTGQGTAQTKGRYDPASPAPLATCYNVHTASTGLGDRLHQNRGVTNIGTGVGYSFHDERVEINVGTANGMGWMADVAATGTCDFTWVWTE